MTTSFSSPGADELLDAESPADCGEDIPGIDVPTVRANNVTGVIVRRHTTVRSHVVFDNENDNTYEVQTVQRYRMVPADPLTLQDASFRARADSGNESETEYTDTDGSSSEDGSSDDRHDSVDAEQRAVAHRLKLVDSFSQTTLRDLLEKSAPGCTTVHERCGLVRLQKRRLSVAEMKRLYKQTVLEDYAAKDEAEKRQLLTEDGDGCAGRIRLGRDAVSYAIEVAMGILEADNDGKIVVDGQTHMPTFDRAACLDGSKVALESFAPGWARRPKQGHTYGTSYMTDDIADQVLQMYLAGMKDKSQKQGPAMMQVCIQSQNPHLYGTPALVFCSSISGHFRATVPWLCMFKLQLGQAHWLCASLGLVIECLMLFFLQVSIKGVKKESSRSMVHGSSMAA